MELADLMHTEVLSVSPDTTMAEAARRMVERDTGAAVVLDDGELVGLVSERDLMRVVSDGVDPQMPVSERMTRHVLTGVPSMSIPDALAIMHEGRFRHLPVSDHGKVVGMVSMRDVMAWTAFRLRHGGSLEDSDDDAAELLAAIHRSRTGAN
jgi:CBS domain-containing protein